MMNDSKYDLIGKGYNTTRKADPYLASRLFHFLKPTGEKPILDIGCGTGNYTVALQTHGLKLWGIDPSHRMLNEAKRRSDAIKWMPGDAENIPTDDNFFGGIVATLTIHHWPDLPKAFSELSRVLDEDGKIVVFTSTPEQMRGYWLNHYFPKMLQTSIEQMPSMEILGDALSTAGLTIIEHEKYFVSDDLQDQFLYVGKNNPSLYFDEAIRSGISSFAALSNADEVSAALEMLKDDITSRHIETVKKKYENDLGDYLFLVINKTQHLK